MKTADDYLDFLRAHQPMPPDEAVTAEQCDAFVAALRHFESHPDPRCLPLFVGAVGRGTGLGMYEDIPLVLRAHDPAQVAACLRVGLEGTSEVQSRCCWWAADVEAWELAAVVRPLAGRPDPDVRAAAQAFLDVAPV